MASIFQPTLSEPQAVESPRGTVQDNTSAQIVRAVGKGIEVAAGIKDRNTLEKVGNELEDISAQEEQFRETQIALEEQILTTRDKQVIDSVNEELLKLERGETSGRLTPAATQARRNALLKQHISDNPWLASDIKSLASARGVGAGVISRTPEEKALDKARELSAQTGVSLGTTFAAANKTFILTKRNEEIAASINEGKVSFPMFREGLNNTIELQRASFLADLFTMIESDPASIDQTDWEPVLENMEKQLRSVSIRSQSEAAQRGVVFDVGLQNQLTKDIADNINSLREVVKGKDALAQTKRYREFVENNGINAMAQMNPLVGSMMALGMDSTAQKLMFDVWPKAVANMNKHGNADQLGLLAAAGDPDAQMAITMLEFNTNASKAMQGKVATGFNPAEGSAVQGVTNLYSSSVLQTGNSENNPVVGNQVQSAAEMLLDEGQNPQELRWFLDNDIQRTTLNTPAIQQGLSNRLDLLDFSLQQEVPEAIHPEVKQRIREEGKVVGTEIQRVSTGTIVFDPTTDSFQFEKAPSKFKARGGDPFPAVTPSPFPSRMGNLNMTYQIRKKYTMFDTSRTDWIQDMLEKLNAVPAISQEAQVENVESTRKIKKVTRTENGSLKVED